MENYIIKKLELENLEALNYNITDELTKKLSNGLIKKLEDCIIEGLKRKGFVFKHKVELEAFVKERCRCEDNIVSKERVYFVNNTPFFLHKYNIESLNMPSITAKEYKITANTGTYTYL